MQRTTLIGMTGKKMAGSEPLTHTTLCDAHGVVQDPGSHSIN